MAGARKKPPAKKGRAKGATPAAKPKTKRAAADTARRAAVKRGTEKAGASKRATAKKTAKKTAKPPEADASARVTRAPARKSKRSTPARRTRPAVARRAPTEARPSTERAPRKRPDRALTVFAELPTERSLTDAEREAMSKVSDAARQVVGADGPPAEVIERIAAFVDDVRLGRVEEPTSQDVRLGLGVLWGEQLRAQVGWRWVHLTYPDGFASYALVPADRAFACFPLNRVPEAFQPSAANTSARVFDAIRDDALPARKPNAYLVIG